MRLLAGFVAVAAITAATLLALPHPTRNSTTTANTATAATAAASTAPPSTVWQTTLLPPALATVTARRGTQQHQLTQPPAAPTTTIPLPPHHDIWLRLAQCESGGNWSINTGNSFYGGLQFTLQSWRGAGGTQWATRPDLASALGQMWTAETLLGMQGWGAWPACARRLGLR